MGRLRNREGARSGPRAEAMNPAPCHGSTRIEFRENTNVMNLHRLHWFPDTQTIRLRKLLEPVSREMPHPPRSPRPPAVPPLRHGAELQRVPAPARDQGRVRVAVARANHRWWTRLSSERRTRGPDSRNLFASC